jgi:glycogen synthase
MTRKLLLYSYDWAPLVGGIQTVTMDLARGICEWSKAQPQNAWEVTLVTQTPADGMDDAVLPFLVVRKPSSLELMQIMRSSDIVHLSGPALRPLIMGWMLRKRIVIAHHGYQSICPNGLLLFGAEHNLCPGHFMAGRYDKCVQCNAPSRGWWRSFIDTALMFPRRLLCKHVAANVAVTNHVASRIALPQTSTILHGVQRRNESAQNGCDANNKFQIAYLGRFVPEKGVPILIEGARELRDMGVAFHLTLIGDGAQREELEQQVQSVGLADCVTFAGYLTGAALEDRIRSVQAVVIPSQCEETAGLSAIEHMMRGGVVVAADIGGLSEVVGDGGFLFRPSDPQDLAQALHRIATDPTCRTRIATKARARALKLFLVEKMVSEHLALYRAVLNS